MTDPKLQRVRSTCRDNAARLLVACLALAGASAAAASLADAADLVYVRDPLTNHLAQRPHTIHFSDADLTGLHWIHWGTLRAIGRGEANVLVCDPTCAGGHRVKGTVRVVLRKRTTEGSKRVYQCIDGRVRGVPKEVSHISWMC